jgi:hypothetical protein
MEQCPVHVNDVSIQIAKCNGNNFNRLLILKHFESCFKVAMNNVQCLFLFRWRLVLFTFLEREVQRNTNTSGEFRSGVLLLFE